ncbi:alpha/beta hydrolase [Parachlamydia sp. AcF125]|uniref:RBBP9/YdeN family alpha/beta hydrolase n=1 Tax=Parachlamydia sp. AcF125 TaxID=2795736 RepID=UPI001BCA50C9|nr:alpha/beta hydrolase [Parachlamydia sp. AcF125]MBS4168350.1 putative hydrolase YdeN [Parachlamydia sp. AcF125]
MLKTILIHGNGGGQATDIWLPYVKKNMEHLGVAVIAKTFPDNFLARSEYWLPFLKKDLRADANTILIGHSSGAVCAMRYAEKYPIFGSVLVAACYTDLGSETEKLSGYYDDPWDWEAIRQNQKWIIQFASTDDPYIPIKEARYIHDKLHTDYYEFSDRGHFVDDHTFKECIIALKSKLFV